jgi:hypothetical protein
MRLSSCFFSCLTPTTPRKISRSGNSVLSLCSDSDSDGRGRGPGLTRPGAAAAVTVIHSPSLQATARRGPVSGSGDLTQGPAARTRRTQSSGRLRVGFEYGCNCASAGYAGGNQQCNEPRFSSVSINFQSTLSRVGGIFGCKQSCL